MSQDPVAISGKQQRKTHSFANMHEAHGYEPVFSAPAERHPVPLSVVRKMMRTETDTTAYGTRIICARCRQVYLTKFMVLIEMPWPKEPDYVDRLCYDKEHDHKLLKGTRAR
jgi:hypothetical protein